MRYVTVTMLAEHAGKHRSSVLRALANAKITPKKIPGVKGMRLPEKDANTFLRRQWPEVGALPLPQ